MNTPSDNTSECAGQGRELASLVIDVSRMAQMSALELLAVYDATRSVEEMLGASALRPRCQDGNNYNAAGSLLSELEDTFAHIKGAAFDAAKAKQAVTKSPDEHALLSQLVLTHEAEFFESLADLAWMAAEASARQQSLRAQAGRDS